LAECWVLLINKSRVQLIVILVSVIIVSLYTRCGSFQPTGYFFISNKSRESRAVDINVSIAGKTVLNDTVRYTGIEPDLSNTPHISLPKGKYIIRVSADNGRATCEQDVHLEDDR
jgi:hypothetical protein